jgi:hypothetical protein
MFISAYPEKNFGEDIPPDGLEADDEYYPPSSRYQSMLQSQFRPDDRPRVPLIVLAQQQQMQRYRDQQFSDGGSSVLSGAPSRLSTITERTERTEASRHWPSRQQLVALSNRSPSSTTSSDTSYGQPLGKSLLMTLYRR